MPNETLSDTKRNAEKTFGLETGSYPFESRYIETDGAKLHYIDEGHGPILFMVHGNPTWSFMYRHLILGLRDDFRCIAVDLAGFGLSKAPEGFDFTPASQAKLLSACLNGLDIQDATLIAHDWGGPIGLSAMLQTERRITRICLGNTWAWPVNGDFHFEWFSRLMGGPIGRFGTKQFAMFVNAVMPAAMKRRKLTTQEMTAYRAPFIDKAHRAPMHILPKHIISSGPWLAEIETGLQNFDGPVTFIWPDSDIAFRDKEFRRWQEIFPNAKTHILENCGHYLWEDAPEDCLNLLANDLA